jgi:GT2 family glycosyltransferase
LEKCSVVGSTVVARRQSLIDAGLFDESFVHGEDFDLWTRLAYRGGRIDYLKRIHTRRRIHDGNLTRDLISSFEGQANVLRKLLRDFDISEELKERMQHQIEKCNASIALEKCKKMLVAREYEAACNELQRANAMYRSSKLQFTLFVLQTAPRVVRYFYVRKQNNNNRIIGDQIRERLPFGVGRSKDKA